MNKHCLATLAVIALLAVLLPGGAMAAQPVKVLLDGESMNFDVPPVFEQGRVLVPMRPIFEAFGKDVTWDAASKTVTARTRFHATAGKTNTMKLTVGQKVAYLDGRPVSLDIPARIVKGRTLIPVRFVSEVLGAEVIWQAATQRVVIKDKQRYYDQMLSYLEQGNLVEARRTAVSAPRKSALPAAPLAWIPPDLMGTTYYFPEGEAGRFYIRQGDHFEFVMTLNMMFTTVWEGNLSDATGETPADTLSKYLARYRSRGFAEEQGERPAITKPLVFFEFHPGTNLIRYGRINPDGQEENVGSVNYDKEATKFNILEIPGEKLANVQPPAEVSAMLASEIPQVELNETEIEEMEREWEKSNFYSYGEIADLNQEFIDVALRMAYLTANYGRPTSSDPKEDLELKKKNEYYLSRFSEEVKNSMGWNDFLALEPRQDPVFNVLQATSTENHITATIVANFFSGFGFVPAILEVEMKKQGDTWLFTRLENVRAYKTLKEMQAAEPATYDLLVKVYNYRYGTGKWLQ